MLSFRRKGLDPHRAFIVSLDVAGKKTAMYRFMQGAKEVERVPPNYLAGQLIETFRFKNGSTYELMSFGGCNGFRTPWGSSRPQKADFVIFVIDVFDQDRLVEAVEELSRSMPFLRNETKCCDMWILFNKQDIVPDARRDQYVGNARRCLASVDAQWAGDWTVRIFDTPGLSARTSDGMQAVVDEIAEFLENRCATGPPRHTVEKPQVSQEDAASDHKLLEARILEANEAAPSSDAFWRSILDCTIESWDHYNHLRAGYFVMLDAAGAGKGMVACSDLFILLLNRLREADSKKFPKSPHRTMTVFWLVQLRLAGVGYQVKRGLPCLPSRDDFGQVLLESPSLMDVSLWNQFYSKDLLFSPRAREEWCLPDLQNFPPGKVAGAEKGA
ncbi:Putative small GTPase superfamily, ARF/SAR type, P-loop containing nucleoside triphosphate hydrolase [Colletotrichum destructivum]|uniref:Small GTPase superfamily, ARF/SAR type, P-loop containing nucleoside triphosphate hydrolase n=1 Tax=Colletotrichum destructivum TaxID=34406 RepID=A0AAX4ISE0_9PEZI|nr:Putative small GTPase superfamily, ARF/SAR type, P-loop containing nucleoside triphosphate hydrolase [Colletotrichum destructivum]